MFPNSRVKVEHSKLVGARPEKVYAILAQMEHHKRILPDAFTGVTASADGTFFITVKIGYAKKTLHIRQEETEPNELFREIDLLTNILTEFRLEPHPDGTLVTIASEYEAKGIVGFIESIFAPKLLRQLYEEELTKLCRYALIATV